MFCWILGSNKTPATQKEMKILVLKMDNDESGYVTVDELIIFIKNSKSTLTECQIRGKFVEFDADQDGKLNPVEAFELYGSFTGLVNRSKLFTAFIPLLKFVYELDVDKDGKVSFEEFKQPLNDLGISDEVFEKVKQRKRYKSIKEFQAINFMHFCVDAWLVANS